MRKMVLNKNNNDGNDGDDDDSGDTNSKIHDYYDGDDSGSDTYALEFTIAENIS